MCVDSFETQDLAEHTCFTVSSEPLCVLFIAY